jgi:hypothetical protein
MTHHKISNNGRNNNYDDSKDQLIHQVRNLTRQLAIEKTEAINRKAVLCDIMQQINKGEVEPRYDFTVGFMSFIISTGQVLNRNPDLVEIYKGDGSEDADFAGVMSIISRYLALNRILDRKEAGLKEWEKRSSLIETDQQEINDEETLLRIAYEGHEHYFNELYDLTVLVYRLLRYINGRDRLIPLFMNMGRDFESERS